MPRWKAEDSSKVTIEVSVDNQTNATITLTAAHAGNPITVQPLGEDAQGIWRFTFDPAVSASFWVVVTAIHGSGDVWMLCKQHDHGLVCKSDATGLPVSPERKPVVIGHVTQGVAKTIPDTGLIGS